jgi:hypothetical protein
MLRAQLFRARGISTAGISDPARKERAQDDRLAPKGGIALKPTGISN